MDFSDWNGGIYRGVCLLKTFRFHKVNEKLWSLLNLVMLVANVLVLDPEQVLFYLSPGKIKAYNGGGSLAVEFINVLVLAGHQKQAVKAF